MQAYLQSMRENSRVLLVAFNVQSLAAWGVAPHFGAWEQLDWKTHKLPGVLRIGSMLLTAASAALGGWMDWNGSKFRKDWSPLGAAFALLGVTMFTPIAWNHYFIVLLLPLLLLLGDKRFMQHRWAWIVMGSIVALNLYPVRYGIEHHLLGPVAIIRTQWYSAVLTLWALWVAQRQRTAIVAPVPVARESERAYA